jgi:glycosyltransferase involved in cell wall biosynthesis
MRIALDCRCAFKGMGGIGRYTWSLLNEYASAKTEHEFVCYFTHLDPPAPLRLPSNFRVRALEAGMIDERFDHLILPSLLEEDRIDLYHNPTFAVPAVRTRARSISTVHDAVFRRHPDLVEPRLRGYLDRATGRAARHADHLITVSEFSKLEIRDLYGVVAERITVIPNGVHSPRGPLPASHLADSTLGTKGLRPKGYVLYVGSIEPKKNVDTLLLAFKEVLASAEAQGLRLALAGSRGGGDYSVEDRVKELGLAGSVVLLGYVPEDFLELLYREALIFVYPSLYEGFGLPPLEAMARGIPTVVANSSSLPEVIGNAGIAVDAKSPVLFARAMLELMRDAALREDLSRKGLARAGELSWRRAAERHLDVYKYVLSTRYEGCPSGV